MKIIPQLKELNLDDNEIRVYLACLKLGSSKVNEIAKKAELIRTTTYGVIKSLVKKGLVSSVKKDNINYYQAADPEELVNILEEKKKKISDVLPELEKMKEFSPKKHNVEFFEGRNGLKTVINDLTKVPDSTVRIIGSYVKFHKFSKPFSEQYHRKRREKNIRVVSLLPKSEEEIVDKEGLADLIKVRFVKDIELDSEIYIYQNKVAFVSFEEDDLRGLIIEDESLFKMQKWLFDSMWERANTE